MTEKEPYHHGDLRQTLIEHALLLLEDKGIDQFSLRDVAKLAGVSHNAPYRHFKNKIELLAVLAEQGFLNLYGSMQHAIARAGGQATEQLIAAGVAYIHRAISHPEMFRLMFSGQLDFEQCPASLKLSADQAHQGLEKIIENGLADNSFKAIDVSIVTTTAWSAMHGLAMLFIAGHFSSLSQHQLDDRILQVAKTVVYGIKNND